MKVLVTGAAGYIGSIVTERLVDTGHEVVALDSLSHGHKAAIHPSARFELCDLVDRETVLRVFRSQSFDAVIHLAAEALIDVSLKDPGLFFRVNVMGGINLLDGMAETGVQRIVFSSTAAVYGEPTSVPIVEDAAKNPVNSYGESKLAFERMLPWYQRAHGIAHVSLRYFNACGATLKLGEWHVPETHLIPIVMDAAMGIRPHVRLNGSDYETPDGTCVRDYVHVIDIAQAHVLALRQMTAETAVAFNLGNGAGFSNREVIDTVRRITGRPVEIVVAPRRRGDPARLVASAERIKSQFGWSPSMPGLDEMVASAWRWRLNNPRPYDT